jgi:hypothetical protein
MIIQDGGVYHPLVEHNVCPVLQYADDTLLLRGGLTDVLRLRDLLNNF